MSSIRVVAVLGVVVCMFAHPLIVVATDAVTEPGEKPTTESGRPQTDESRTVIFEETFDSDAGVSRLHQPEAGEPPAVRDGKLHLLQGLENENASVGFAQLSDETYRQVDCSFDLTLTRGGRGVAFALLNTAHFSPQGPAFAIHRAHVWKNHRPEIPKWDEPNLWGSLAFGFDIHNPPTRDRFDKWGNVYNRPQHEVSVHWDGREIHNVLSPVDFASGENNRVEIRVSFVTGGALVEITVGSTPVVDGAFVPFTWPYRVRPAFGGLNGDGETPSTATIDNLRMALSRQIRDDPAPIAMPVMSSVHLTRRRSTHSAEVALLPEGLDYTERILATYTFRPMVDRDEWDRNAAFHVDGADGTRYEIGRVITPFMLWGETYTYTLDVTRFAPLLTGRRTVSVHAGANSHQGFVVDLTFTYFRRPADVAPLPKTVSIEPLWNGEARFNVKGAVDSFFAPREIEVPKGADRLEVYIVVTGHGSMEFRPMGRTLHIDGVRHSNRLWCQTSYLNPWRPQFGTWKYDRAGWSPGAAVEPWTVEVESIGDTRSITLDYESETHEASGWASHWVAGYAIFQRTAEH
jgi:hypothetical protein